MQPALASSAPAQRAIRIVITMDIPQAEVSARAERGSLLAGSTAHARPELRRRDADTQAAEDFAARMLSL
jgi:hypothetical protein